MKIPKPLSSVSSNPLQLPQTPEDQDPGILPSSLTALSAENWNLLSVTETGVWELIVNRQIIWNFWCKNHLPFRIPPLLNSSYRFYLTPTIPTSVPSPHPQFTCPHWKPCSGHLINLAEVTLHSLFNKSFLILTAYQSVHSVLWLKCWETSSVLPLLGHRLLRSLPAMP